MVSSPSTILSPTRHSLPSSQLPRTSLMDLVRMQQWKTILDHPDHFFRRRNAKYRDADGLYPLHWACSGGAPVTIVQALLLAYPSAARKQDTEGSTPLHFACHYAASASVVEALVSVYPDASQRQDKYGRTPLYHAVDKSASLAVLQALIKVDLITATTPCLPEPLRRGRTMTRGMAVRTPLFLAWAAVLADARTRQQRRGKPWDKAKLLLEAACPRDNDNNSLLCRAICMDLYLPEGVVPLLLPTVADEDGHVPLSLAAATHHYSPERAQAVFQRLLTAFPTAAASQNDLGQSPLALAVASGKTWDEVQLLFAAAPQAIGWRDSVTGLPPTLVAATACPAYPPTDDNDMSWLEEIDPYQLMTRKHRLVRQERQRRPTVPRKNVETAQVETIFELLLADPTVVG
jgi:ankyrin repeat protein